MSKKLIRVVIQENTFIIGIQIYACTLKAFYELNSDSFQKGRCKIENESELRVPCVHKNFDYFKWHIIIRRIFLQCYITSTIRALEVKGYKLSWWCWVIGSSIEGNLVVSWEYFVLIWGLTHMYLQKNRAVNSWTFVTFLNVPKTKLRTLNAYIGNNLQKSTCRQKNILNAYS